MASRANALRRDQQRLRRQLAFFFGCLVLGLVVIVSLAYETSRVVRVGGPSYSFIIDKKELIADVLPPPGYVVESYLLVFQIVDEADGVAQGKLEERLRMLENDYRRTHARWASKLPEGDLRASMILYAYGPAMDFYAAVHRGDKQAARSAATGRLKKHFVRHRQAIEDTVAFARAESAMAERNTAQLIEQRTLVLVVLGVTVGLAVVGLGIVLGRRILFANQLLAHELGERRRVEDNLRASETLRRDALTRDSAFKSALLLSITHDLRAPLASIGASASLMTQTSTVDGRNEQLGIIEDNSREMLQLVNNLLEMLRLESGALEIRRELQYVDEIIPVALHRSKHTLGNRRVDIRVADDLPPVKCDDVLLLVVLTNLIDNAVKYSPESSPILIEVSSNEMGVDVAMTNEVHGNLPASWDEMFVAFRRDPAVSQRKTRGTGLGLTICKGIMEAHGGRISIESRPSGKTTVSISIPSAQDRVGSILTAA